MSLATSRRLLLHLLSAAGLFAPSLLAQGSLPPVPVPPENPITEGKRILGKLLFWEEQMSSNNLMACGTCHLPASGGGDPRRVPTPGLDGILGTPDDNFASPGVIRSDANNEYLPAPAFGFNPQVTRRASPSFLMAAWFPRLFWDGRFAGDFTDPQNGQLVIAQGGALEAQAMRPIPDGVEMGHDGRTWTEVVQKLTTSRPMALATNVPADMAAAIAGGATYPDLFNAAFGDPTISARRIAFAIATYERTLVADQTPWDRFQNGQPTALTPNQLAGLNLFQGSARCNLCHTPPLFTDGQFHNLGLRPIVQDGGLQEITGIFADRGKFKVPSLRNVGLRSSLFHAGGLTTLNIILNFYVAGGGTNLDNKDPLLQPIVLAPPQRNSLIDFLDNALTDPRVAAEQFPFDRPTLRSELQPPQGFLFGPGSPGTGGFVPLTLAEVPANLGNVDFKVGVGNARGGAPVTFVLSLQPAPIGSQIQGVNVNADVWSGLLVNGMLHGTSGVAGAGYGTIRIPLPSDQWLSGLTLFTQWFVWDAATLAGAASTRGAELRLF